MDLIAERGIAAHYSGKVVPNMLGQNIPAGRNSKGKTACLKNSDFALRVRRSAFLYESAQVGTQCDNFDN